MTEVTDYGLSEVSAAPVAEDEGSSSTASFSSEMPLTERVIAALRTVFDPEIPVNIYDLGLIYRIAPMGSNEVEIDMTLTAPGCPVAGEMVNMVHRAVRDVGGVANAKVNLVFDPPWDQTRMSEEAKLELGFF